MCRLVGLFCSHLTNTNVISYCACVELCSLWSINFNGSHRYKPSQEWNSMGVTDLRAQKSPQNMRSCKRQRAAEDKRSQQSSQKMRCHKRRNTKRHRSPYRGWVKGHRSPHGEWEVTKDEGSQKTRVCRRQKVTEVMTEDERRMTKD